MAREEADAPAPQSLPLVGEAEIHQHVSDLAAAITRDHPEAEPLVIVAIMKGALVLLADLVRHLSMPIEIELVNARSYRGAHRQDRVEVLDDVTPLGLEGKQVLLLDCVLDSGHTLKAVRDAIAQQAPASLKTCVLLSKQRPRSVEIDPEYVGLEIPDVFVVGYGLDYDNRWRHLPYIAELPQARAPGEDGW